VDFSQIPLVPECGLDREAQAQGNDFHVWREHQRTNSLTRLKAKRPDFSGLFLLIAELLAAAASAATASAFAAAYGSRRGFQLDVLSSHS
jgi:hypothetical protein